MREALRASKGVVVKNKDGAAKAVDDFSDRAFASEEVYELTAINMCY